MRFLAKLKFWFDLGQSFLSVATFALVLLSTLDRISARLHLSGSLWQGAGLIAAGLIAVVVSGMILDKGQFQQHYTRELNSRNEAINEIKDKLK